MLDMRVVVVVDDCERVVGRDGRTNAEAVSKKEREWMKNVRVKHGAWSVTTASNRGGRYHGCTRTLHK